jgi:ATP-dependent Clp protease ATP-binding subunit ClpB
LNKRLADRRVTVSLDPKAKEWVAEKGYDPVFGARPLKRFLQRHLGTRLARALIGGEVSEGASITFTVQNDELATRQEASAAKK